MEEKLGKEQLESQPNNRIWLWIVILSLIIGIIAVALLLRDSDTNVGAPSNTDETTQAKAETWQAGGAAITGKYADADVVGIGDGQYRMYYAAEPEVPNFNGQIYAAKSSDGIVWTEEGEIKQAATFPDVVKLSDGRYRMYFQNRQEIKSAISSDGLAWVDEAGTRVAAVENGFPEIKNVGAPSTVRLDDGSYLMVYAGTIENQKYNSDVPNNKIELFFHAVSTDGLTWQKKGVAIDSRNSTLEGLADGPELIGWDGSASLAASDNDLRLYFWSYRGIYHTKYENGLFSDPVLDFRGENVNENVPYSPNPPSDPTLIKINDNWFMYYGQHEKGIYYTTLGD